MDLHFDLVCKQSGNKEFIGKKKLVEKGRGKIDQ